MHSREEYSQHYATLEDPDPRSMSPACPWCDSTDTEHVLRGFTGPTDDRNQHLICHECERVTWEIVSRTARDMRMGHFRVGGVYRDNAQQTKYIITRILKVGLNEVLLYVKPIQRNHDERSGGNP